MANFSLAYPLTMKVEGGYSFNPNDRGGETYAGIARKHHPDWEGWKKIDAYSTPHVYLLNEQLKNDSALQESVKAFYKKEYWDTLKLDQVNNERIAQELFDTGVNMGTGISAVFLQRALNVTNKNGKDYPDLKIDGNIGAKTIAALNNHIRPHDVLKTLNILQGERYISICEASPSQETFFSGWLARVFE